MGKYLESKYADVHSKVFKKAGRSNQRSKESKTATTSKCKRKLSSTEQELNPPSKKSKTSYETDKVKNPDPNNFEELQDLQFQVKSYPRSNVEFLKLVKEDGDLFSEDDLKACYDQYTKYNLLFTIYDEIALEGLDGITLEAFWKRLNVAVNFTTSFDLVQDIIWNIICSSDEISFFKLAEPRGELVLFNRDEHVNEEIGTFMETCWTGQDIYKYEVAPKGDLLGSCSTFTTRVDITAEVRGISLTEASTMYGNELVMVASQKMRTKALFSEMADPNYELMAFDYCLLERMGRSRTLGEITQGSQAITHALKIDSKTLHLYLKRLSAANIITKQPLIIRSSLEQSICGRLVHLRRFYSKVKSKQMLCAEAVVNYLKKCPYYQAPYTIVRGLVRLDKNLHKFFKQSEILKYVDTNVILPYKEVHPGASEKEWLLKNHKEKIVRLIRLKDPTVNIRACWTDSLNDKPDSSDEEDVNDDNDDSDGEIGKGHAINVDFLRQIYLKIYSKGPEGCQGNELFKTMNLDFPSLRASLKRMVSKNLVSILRVDKGRQRSNLYVAKCFLENPSLTVNLPVSQSIVTGKSTFLEKLKERQRAKIESIGSERVYTREHQEADFLAALEKPVFLRITCSCPDIVCEYFIKQLMDVFEPEYPIMKAHFSRILKKYDINLTLPELGDIAKLREILPNNFDNSLPKDAFSLENNYIELSKPDYITKAVLLLALFGKIQINKKEIILFLDPNNEALNCTVKKLRTEGAAVKPVINYISVLPENEKYDFMGPKPVLISEEKEHNVTTEVIMSTPPETFITGDTTRYKLPKDCYTTTRMLSRIQIILEKINTDKVFEEMPYIERIIRQTENNEGYDKIMDRKSCRRLIRRLVIEGYVKVYQVVVSDGRIKKTRTFICHPSIDHQDEAIKVKVDQIKGKFFIGDRRNTQAVPVVKVVAPPKASSTLNSAFKEKDVRKSINEMKRINKVTPLMMKIKPSKTAGRSYGFRPKFARMSALHELLFNFIYVMNKDIKPLSTEEVVDLFRRNHITLSEEELKNLPPVYAKELTWKIFLPPLPRHLKWGRGWTLICDVLMRMPLTILLKIHCVNFYYPELQEYAEHPLKKFYLLKDLPGSIRNVLLHKRKLIFDINDVLVNLAYCGLVQFGPGMAKEKDQTFIYLNRRASLMETMSSEPGYHKISDMDYNTIYFYFNTTSDLLKFWSKMHEICMNTKLNLRNVMKGQTITIVPPSAKPNLQKALWVKTPEEAKRSDNGDIPGDHRGAAGLDSSLWSHIAKNWFYTKKEEVENTQENFDSLEENAESSAMSLKQLASSSAVNKFYLLKPAKISLKSKPKTIRRLLIKQRCITNVKRMNVKMPRRDQLDVAILSKMNCDRFKPQWSLKEDVVAILLKFADKFLFPKSNKVKISYYTLRDVLHRIVPESRDKTSMSIARRLKHLRRTIPILENIDNFYTNLYKLAPINQYFGPLVHMLNDESSSTEKMQKFTMGEVQNAFMFLSYYLTSHQTEVEQVLQGNLITIDYFNKDNLEFYKLYLEPFEEHNNVYSDIKNESDVTNCLLKSIFHSAVAEYKHQTVWSYQLYKIYQRFNENDLKNAIIELKDQRMLSQVKTVSQKLLSMPLRISATYVSSQSTIFTYQHCQEAYYTFLKLKNDPNSLQFSYSENIRIGQLLALNEVSAFLLDNINMELLYPKYALILNPNVDDHDEVIEEIAKRYQAKLKTEQKETELQISPQIQGNETNEVTEEEPVPSASMNIGDTIIYYDDDEPMDLSMASSNSITITNLKHWISDCIDSQRVRSPSPELLQFDNAHSECLTPQVTETDVYKGEMDERFMDKVDTVLSLEEIKEEMLKSTSSNEKRLVPYISDLIKLLDENIDDTEVDENIGDRLMKKHFVLQYPSVEHFEANGLNDERLLNFVERRDDFKKIWERVARDHFVSSTNDTSKAFEEILLLGGTVQDVDMANSIIEFVLQKGVLGATGPEIKQTFGDVESCLSLESVIKILAEFYVLLRTGSCSLTFVHCKYASSWLIDNFILTEDLREIANTTENSEFNMELMDAQFDSVQWRKIRLFPWAKVDGTLNKELFKFWLGSIFSYCIENPKIMLPTLFKKFNFLKPIDIFYVAEVLQEIGCINMFFTQYDNSPHQADEYSFKDRPATFLDTFEDIFIETNDVSFILLGSFCDNI